MEVYTFTGKKKKKKEQASSIGEERGFKQGCADVSDSPPLMKTHRPPSLGVERHARDPERQE